MSEQAAAQKMTPEDFFEKVVPSILEATKDRAERLGAVYDIHLFGDPEAEWTIDLAKATVRKGPHDKPDLYLEMDRDDFRAMMLGRLNVESAIRSGRIRFDGELQLLARFAELLRPKDE